MKYKIAANPKGGTCFQFIEADSEEEAIEKAKANPNGWKVANPQTAEQWNYRAYEMIMR